MYELPISYSMVTAIDLPSLSSHSTLHRLQDFCGVGVLNEPYNPAAANGPQVGERSAHRPAGGFVGAGVSTQRHHSLPLHDVALGRSGESVPIARKRREKTLNNLLRGAPRAAIIWEA